MNNIDIAIWVMTASSVIDTFLTITEKFIC
jgi:hypothetical protein